MNTQIKPLEWTVFCSRSGNSVAKTPFGEYVIQIEPDGWCLYLLNSDDPHASYSMSDFAKAAAQADYETRILSALISSPGKDGGSIVEALKTVLASLVATTSLIIRAEDMKVKPSKAVASDAMFLQMLKDYDAATSAGRAAIMEISNERD